MSENYSIQLSKYNFSVELFFFDIVDVLREFNSNFSSFKMAENFSLKYFPAILRLTTGRVWCEKKSELATMVLKNSQV